MAGEVKTYVVYVGNRSTPCGYIQAAASETAWAWENVDDDEIRRMAALQTEFMGSDSTYEHIHLGEGGDGPYITLQAVYWVRVEEPDAA